MPPRPVQQISRGINLPTEAIASITSSSGMRCSYPARAMLAEDSAFTGTVDSVLLEIAEGATDFNHLVDPQLRLSMALARQ